MKKIIVIAIIILALISASCQKTDYDQLKLEFDNLLNSKDYQTANSLYQAASDQRIDYYNQSLTDYSAALISDALNNMSAEQAKSALTDFLVFEYTQSDVQKALDQVIAAEQALAQSNEDYLAGTNLFIARDFDAAYEKLAAVSQSDANYQSALDMMAAIESRNAAWEEAAANNLTGRNPSVNSLAYKDDYIYFPVNINDMHSIVKHNYTTGETQMFPLSDYAGSFRIEGINVVGEYIYFIAGEEIGRGEMFDSPYCIYEMKTDGTELTMVKAGDYFDLISYGDTFYALSYTKGLVKMDKNFTSEEVISDKWVVEMYVSDKGVYYTERLENTCDSKNILHLYSGGTDTVVLEGQLLHTYFFDGYSIFYKDIKNNLLEEMYLADTNVDNAQRLATSIDITRFIGAMDGKVIYSSGGTVKNSNWGDMRQDIYTEISFDKKVKSSFQDSTKPPEFEVLSVLYEQSMLLVESNGIYSITNDVEHNISAHLINIPAYDETMLQTNNTILNEYRISDDQLYTDEEVVVVKDNLWYYSSPTLNVVVEEYYDEYIETNIFTATIKTNDPSAFSIGYNDVEPALSLANKTKAITMAQKNKAVWASSGDFALEPTNANTVGIGIVIRDGEALKKYPSDDFLAIYPDGSMVAYYGNEGITWEQLIEEGVQNTLSFGPILVKDDERTSTCEDPSEYISGANPRCAWGMVEPGHYINVIADGRQPNVSRGMSFYTLSTYFRDLGCSVAYNLDGGQTAAGVFLGNYVNTHENDNNGAYWNVYRNMPEIIYFGQSDLVPANLEDYYEND